jgi:hypothetical protein
MNPKSTIFVRFAIFYNLEATSPRIKTVEPKMMDDGEASRDEMRRAVKQAIVLNEYLLRRAWGVLFLALSLSMFLSIFGLPIIDSLGALKLLGVSGSLVIDLTASGCGIIAILWAFKRVRNTAEITQPEGDRAWSRLLGYRFVLPLWVSINAIVISTLILARIYVPLVVLLIHLGLAFYLYYALRLSFSRKIPAEAVIAIASLSLSSISSIALLSVTTSSAPFALLWAATIVVWIFAGVYARTRHVPEFEEELTGLE